MIITRAARVEFWKEKEIERENKTQEEIEKMCADAFTWTLATKTEMRWQVERIWKMMTLEK